MAGVGAWPGPRGDWVRAQQRRHRRGDWTRGPAGGGARSSEVGAGRMGRRRHRADRAGAAGALPEAIAALSRALPAGPSPETFRRAKFDRPEAVRPRGGRLGGVSSRRREAAGTLTAALRPSQAPALWQLLFSVLSQLRADSASASLSPGKPHLPSKPHLPPKPHPWRYSPPAQSLAPPTQA